VARQVQHPVTVGRRRDGESAAILNRMTVIRFKIGDGFPASDPVARFIPDWP
jgi:hypothetical protein